MAMLWLWLSNFRSVKYLRSLTLDFTSILDIWTEINHVSLSSIYKGRHSIALLNVFEENCLKLKGSDAQNKQVSICQHESSFLGKKQIKTSR